MIYVALYKEVYQQQLRELIRRGPEECMWLVWHVVLYVVLC